MSNNDSHIKKEVNNWLHTRSQRKETYPKKKRNAIKKETDSQLRREAEKERTE